jgi:hypothetical protein
MREELEAWKNKNLLNNIATPEVDPIKRALSIGKELCDLPIQDIEDVLLVLSNYYVYLSSEIGHLSARINYLDGELMRIVSGTHTNHKYFTEKRQAIVAEDAQAGKIDGTLILEKSKYEILKPIVDGLRFKIDAVKRIHDRRARSRINVN